MNFAELRALDYKVHKLLHQIEHAAPTYSDNAMLAWNVADALYEKGWLTEIEMFKDEGGKKCHRARVAKIGDEEKAFVDFDETMPSALCRAAVHALESEA